MKLNCGPTEQERKQEARDRYCHWHRWFAWFPVRVGSRDCRWLEFVDRRARFVGDVFMFENAPCQCEYRPLRKEAA